MTPFIRPAADPLETPVAAAINRLWLADEETVLRELRPLARQEPAVRAEITAHAAALAGVEQTHTYVVMEEVKSTRAVPIEES